MNPAIVVNHISYQYDDATKHALKDVSFQVNKGDWVSIVGHNGSGKSTLVKLLGAIMPIQQGTIEVCDIPVIEERWYDIHGHVGMVFQNPDNQFVGATVEDDVAFGLENYGVLPEEMYKRVNAALESVNMAHMLTHEPHHLSGGQKQRVAIASVIALRPDIIILDEATAMLDPEGRREILNVIQSLQEELNLTVIAITHDLEETLHANQVIVLSQGEIKLEGTPKEIFSRGDELTALGLELPFAMQVYKAITHDTQFITDEELLRLL